MRLNIQAIKIKDLDCFEVVVNNILICTADKKKNDECYTLFLSNFGKTIELNEEDRYSKIQDIVFHCKHNIELFLDKIKGKSN